MRLERRGELGLVAGGAVLYGLARLRSRSRHSTALDNARQVLGFERAINIDCELAVQRVALRSDTVRWVANAVYTWTYWPVLLGSLAALRRHDPHRHRVLLDGILLSGVAGLIIFVRYPVAPPRMLPGFVDTIGPDSIEHSIVHGSLANPYAALPSFHVGWFALAVATAAASTTHPVAMPGAIAAATTMSAAVVITGNHYLVDIAAGVAVSFAGGALAAHLSPARAASLRS